MSIDNQISSIAKKNKDLANCIDNQYGCLTMENIKELAKDFPTHMLLVRCGNGRFVTAADSVEHFCEVVGKSKQDYVRDVSLVVDDWIPNRF
jgi:hypothetical protein